MRPDGVIRVHAPEPLVVQAGAQVEGVVGEEPLVVQGVAKHLGHGGTAHGLLVEVLVVLGPERPGRRVGGRHREVSGRRHGRVRRERERERSALPESENLVELRSVSVEPSARDEALAVHREDHGLVRGEDAEAGREPGFRPEAKAARERGGRVGQHEDPGQGWESPVASFCLLLSRLTSRDVPCARRDDAVALAADRDAGPAVEVVPGRGEARRGEKRDSGQAGQIKKKLNGSVRAGGRVAAAFPASSQEGGRT